MNKTYVIKINSATATVKNVQVTSGRTQPTTVKVDGNVNVELLDTATGKAPHKISVRRVGKDLHVAFEGGDPAHSDLILQDFYDENDNHLIGLAENGQYFEYIPTSGEGGFYAPLMSDGTDAIQALGGAELAGAAWAPMFASAFPIGAVLGAIGAIGLAGVAIAAGGGSHKVEALTTPTQRPNSYLDNVGPVQNPNSTATLTDDTTPGLHIGALPGGATGAVLYVDGVIKPATYDPATGTLTPTSPLPDGVHTLGYGLTNAVGTTPSSPTLTLTIDSTAPPTPILHVADTDGDGKPNLTGTGEPGGLVTITDPAGGKHTTVVDPTGKFELEIDMPSKPLGEWIATVTDPADNVSLPGKTIVTDLTAPTAPVAGVYDNVGSIQGLVPNKGVTDDATPAVSGTAEPGSVVTIMNDGKPVGTVLADGSGVWSFTLPPLVDGTYTVTTKATDSQGNAGPTSIPVVFTVDTMAPPAITASTLTDDVGRIQGPIVNGTITDDANPTFTGKAEAGATITIRDGGVVQGTALVDAGGDWIYPSTTLAPGAHSFTATVTDPAGNVSPATTPINFTVDLTVPTIAVNQIKDDVGAILGALNPGDITDDNKPTITGTGTPGGVVKLYLDGTTTVIGTTVVDSSGQWAITPTTPLIDGKHDLTVTVTTVATGENPPTAPFALTVDATPPSAPAIASVDDNVGRIQGHVTAGAPSDDTTPLLTGKAEAGSIVQIFDGGQLIGTAIADGSGIWTLTPSPALDDGVHPITMTATDKAGNVSAVSAPWNVVIDTAAPTTPTVITQVFDDQGSTQGIVASGISTIIDDDHPDFTGTAEANTTVIIKDGAAEIGTAAVNASGVWTFTPLAPLLNGIHHVTASAMDTAGNIGPVSSVFDFRLITGGVPTAPAITTVIDDVGTVSVVVPNGVTNDSTPRVEGTALAGSTVKLYAEDGTLLGTTTSDVFGQWSITTLPLSEGAHSLVAKAVDLAGNLSAPTGPYPFVVDTQTPVTATALLLTDDVGPIVGAITNGMNTDDATPTFSGEAEAGATVIVSDGTTVLGTVLVNPAGTWTFTSPHLENGTHSFSAIVADPAGNVSLPTTPINFTLDASAVKISIDEVLDDVSPIVGVLAMNASTNDATPTVSGSSTPGGAIKLYLDGTTAVIGTATADSTGHWVITPTERLVDGLHNLTATVTTPATGESLATSAFKLTVDTALPATPTIVSAYDNVGRIQGNVAAGIPSDDTTPRLTGKAEAGSTVAVFDGSVYLGATMADAAGNWAFTPVSPLNNGTHPITVTATDAAGNVSLPSLPWALLIDTIAPTIVPVITSVVDDQGASQGLLATGLTTDDARPAFTGTAEANTTVVIRDGTVELGTALVNASGGWTFTPPTLLFNGFHHVTASELDAAGNVGPASVPFDFQLISGGVPTAPAITNVIDDVGTISNVEPFGLTNDRTPTVEGTAVPGSIVSLFSEDGTPLGTTTADARGQWSITTPNLADGPHSLTATATDTTGIPSAPTGPYQIVVDATLPKVATNPVLTDNVGTVTGPILNNGVTDDATPTFTGSAEAGATVSVKDNGSELGTALVDAAGNWTFTSPHLEPGLHAFTATVMDAAGNASAPTTPINFTLDTSGVAIAIDQVLDDFGPIIGVLAMNASTDDRNPTVSGTATVGGTVKLYLDGTTSVIGTATADSAGHWVITPVTSLLNGLHNLTATVTTATAVESPATAAFTFTVDAVVPSRPAILSAVDNVGSIQGTIPVGSAAPIDDSTPGLAGTADPGTTVTIFDAGQPIGTALVDAAGVWKFTPTSPLNDGTHPLTVRATDAAGNVSAASAPWNLLIDTVAPTIVPLITLVYDDQGTTQGDVSSPSGVTDDSLPLVSGTSEPNGSVIIRDGLAVIGTAAVNSAGVWSFLPTTVLVNGAHILSATAVDAAGNVGLTSPVRAFTVVTGGIPTAPAITNVLDDVGAFSSVPQHGFTNDPTPTVEGTAKPGETVRLYNESGVLVGTIVADINGQWLITSPTLVEGAHSFTATSTDLAGNVSAPTAPYQIVVDFTVAAATAAVLNDDVGPKIGLILDNDPTDDTTPTYTGVAEAGATVTVMDGIAKLGTALVDAAGNWSFTPKTPLDPGAHAFTAIVTDAAGNVSAPTTPIHFTVDLTAQIVEISMVTDDVVAITGPLAQKDMTNDPRPTVSGKATAGGVVKLYDETGAMLGAAVADNAGHWTITPAFDLPEGTHNLTATVTTAAASESAPTAAFTLTVDATKPIAPVIVSVTDDVGTVRGLEAAGAPSDDTTPTLTGTAEALSTVTILDGTVKIGTATTDAKGNWTFTPISPLNEGVHAITVTATDEAGNVSPPSAPWSLLIDTISPTIVPVITSVYDDQGTTQGNVPNNPVWVTDDSLPLISGTSEPNGSVVIRDGLTVLGTAAVSSTGLWSFTPTTVLVNGAHILSATAVDAAGNVGLMSAVHAFTVVTGGIPTAPAITNVLDDVGGFSSVERHGVTNDSTPTVEGTAKAGQTVRLYNESGAPVGTVVADVNGQWLITSPALADGAHSFTATATDLAGNVSAPTAPYQIVVDTTAPAMATDLVLNDNVNPKIGVILDKDSTDDATPTYTGKAEAGATVTVMDGIEKLGTALVNAAGDWSFTPTKPLEPGAHAFSTVVTDAAGNVSPATAPIHFTLDTRLVTIAIDQVLDDVNPIAGVLAMSARTDDTTPTVSGTATPGGLVKLYRDGTTIVIGTATADSTGHWVITPTTALVDGLHNLTATVTTAAASESAPTAAFTLTVDATKPIAPVIVSVTDDVGTVRGLEAAGAPSDDTTPTLTGTAEALSTVTILDGTVKIGTATTDAKGNWTFTPISPLNEGVHAITVTATDEAGNVSPPSAPWSLLIDTISPTIVPVITSVYDDQGLTTGTVANDVTVRTDDSQPLVSGTSEPNGSVIIKDGLTVLGTAAVDSAGLWTFMPTTVLLNGPHILTATAVDAAGNTGLTSGTYSFLLITGGLPTSPAITNVIDDVGTVSNVEPFGVTNDQTPTVKGTALQGAVVSLFNELGALLGTALVDVNGQWSITTPLLVPGPHSFTATATNVSGNVSLPTDAYPITVDITVAAATVPVLTDNVGPTIGQIVNNGFTDDATPTFTGKAEAGTTVTVMDGIEKLGTTLVNAAGNWSFTSPHLENGVHVFAAIVTDLAGNVSAPTTPIHFTLDASAVVIAIDQVLDDVNPIAGVLAMGASTNDTMPTVSGTATAGGLVKLYRDGTTAVIGTATADSTGHWVITLVTPLVEGAHILTATVTTAAASESPPTAAFALTVDATKPIAPVIVSSTDDVGLHKGLIANGGPSDDSTPTLRGTAEALSTVILYDGAVRLGTTVTDAAGNWIFTPASPLNDGTHPITATATDAAGNVSPPSVTWNELIDTARPVTPVIVTVEDNFGIYQSTNLASGTPSNDNTPTLTGTAEALNTVTIKDNGVAIATVMANAAGIWTYTPTTATKLLDGIHPLTVTSTDAAGNESQPASFLSVIDTAPPPTPFIDFSNDDVPLNMGNLLSNTPTNDTTPRMSGRAEPLSKVELFDNLTIVGSTMADAAGNWTITPTPLTAQGAHPMTVTATDAAGNISVHSAIWVELIDTIAPIPPVIVSANDNVLLYGGDIPRGVPTNDPTPLMSGTAEKDALITLYDNGVLTGTALANALGNWSYTPTLTTDGNHSITATATDAAGNTSPPSLIWTVNLDTVIPRTPDIGASKDEFGSLQGNVAAGLPTNDDTPLMSGTAERDSLITLYDGGMFAGTTMTDVLGGWSFTPTLVGDGIHAMKITSTDAAGNVSADSQVFGVLLDTTAPVFTTNPDVAVNENTATSSTPPGTVIYTAVSTDASNVTYAITGGADAGRFYIDAATGQVRINFYPDYEAPGDSGGNNVYDYVVTATDAAGNATNQNASMTVLNVPEAPVLVNTMQVGGRLWIMAGGSGQTLKNHFVMGRLTSDIPVTYTTNVGFIKVRSDGVIYTEGAGNPAYSVGGGNIQTFNYYPTSVQITATSATGESTSFTIGVQPGYGNLNNPGGPYPNYSPTYTSPFVPPVTLDLNHDDRITYNSAAVDVKGDGLVRTSAWVASQDGVLVWDKFHDGKVHDSSQYAFAQYLAGAKTDLEGLKAFDTNKNGKLDGGDAVWNEMRVWQDLNGNGVSDAGEIKTLAAWGLTSINLTSDGVVANPFAGVQESGKSSALLADGSQMVIADVTFDAYTTGGNGETVAHPFVLDMNHDGQITYDKALIDVSGTGYKELIAWAGKGDGVLVWDKYQDGLVHDSSQYSFGSLKIFDTNGDSKLDSHDVLWSQLSVWQDANGDGVSEAGEVKTLAQLGIQSIGITSDGVVTTPAEGVKELGKSAAVMEDGSAMTIAQAAVSHVATDMLHPLSYLDQTYAVI